MSSKAQQALTKSFVSFLLLLALFLSGVSGVGFALEKVELSEDDKRQVFEKVWNLINERYYDPKLNGVDWEGVRDKYLPEVGTTQTDEEFYDVLKRMVSEMKDAHTRFLTPREARERRARVNTTLGILLSRIDGKTVVEKVLSDAEGDLARIKPGMILTSIDGIPVEERFEKVKNEVGGSSSDRALEIFVYRRMLRGEPGTAAKIGLIGFDGKEFEVTLTRKVVSESSEASAKILPSGLGYIAVTSFKSPISDKFKNALNAVKDTPALIIDLRYNGGGSINEVLRVAGVFLDRKRSFGSFSKRSADSKKTLRKFFAGEEGKQLYSKPLIILTSKFSASGSELFASGLQELGRAKVIGTQTCGCLLGISRKHRLPGGSELHISDIGFISAKGNVYEKVGVTPDKVLDLDIADLRRGFDRSLALAESMLNDITAEH